MVCSSDGGGGSPHNKLDRAAVLSVEDARADASDKEDLELLQVRVAVQGLGLKHLLGGDSTLQWSRGAGRRRAGVRLS
jgi:hypothetical protein